jgi:hypothetical protein
MSGLGLLIHRQPQVPETAVEAGERGSAFFPTSNFGWGFAAQRQARAMQRAVCIEDAASARALG